MKFRQKLKKDKKFRLGLIVFISLIFIGFHEQQDKKTGTPPEICDLYDNTGVDGKEYMDGDDIDNCILNGCSVVIRTGDLDPNDPILNWIGNKLECILQIVAVPASCESEVKINDRYISDSPSQSCETGKIEEVSKFCTDKVYQCLFATTSQRCNDAQANIASIVQSFGVLEDNCKAAYYVTIFGGGMLAFMTLGTIL